MSSSIDDATNEIARLHPGEEEITWTPQRIMVNVATSCKDDTLKKINLADTLGKGKCVVHDISDMSVYWLPKKQFSQNSPEFRSTVLAPLFVNACRDAGFAIFMKGWEPKRCSTRFFCKRSKFFEPKKGKNAECGQDKEDEGDEEKNDNDGEMKNDKGGDEDAGPTNTTTDPPTRTNKNTNAKKGNRKKTQRPLKGKDIRCPFSFTVYWSELHCRWFLPKQQRGNPSHCGHARILAEGEEPMDLELRRLLQMDAYDAGLPLYTQMAQCVKTKEEWDIFRKGMNEIHKKILNSKSKRRASDSAASVSADSSPVQKKSCTGTNHLQI